MKEKNVILFVRGEQSYDGTDPEVTELMTEGVMTLDGERVELSYEESELTGMEGTTTHFIIEKDQVVLERRGTLRSRLDFHLGGQCSSLYETPWGTMVVDVSTIQLAHRLGEHGGVLELRFTIAINHQVTGENRFKIRVREAARPAAGPA